MISLLHPLITVLVSLATALSSPSTRPSRPQAPATSAKTREQYRAFALTHQGDAARGKGLFFNEQKLACSRCHRVGGQGGEVGPDLSSIGDKFGRQELIESVLYPSATIAVGYSTTVVKTKSGEMYEGIVKEATERTIALAGSDGKLVRIPADQIERQRTTDVSLMPEDLQAGLTQAEFTDLVAYLTTLRVPETAAATAHGMPPTIPVLAHPVALVPFIEKANHFEHPVWFGPVPGVPNAFTVVEHETGKIWLLDKGSAIESKTVFLDTGKYQTGTRGLIGMVFHPKYRENRRYFIVKHLIDNGRFASIIFEGKASADLRHDSGEPLKRILKINAVTNVHYGGSLAFGPEGFLYIGMGDSGPQGDPQGHAQNLDLLLGKILRIDVDHADAGLAYAIPKDNPFVARTGVRPEIWAYGLREPWRFSFDPLTHDLWVGDVGQDLFEEVDIVRKGENYGWNVYEGFQPYSNRYRRDGEKFVPPIFAWTRKYGASATGGFVYRADPASSFYGVYIFGDYQNSRIFGLTREDRKLKKVRLLLDHAPQHVVSFGQDGRGGLYVVGYEGMIYRLDLSVARFE